MSKLLATSISAMVSLLFLATCSGGDTVTPAESPSSAEPDQPIATTPKAVEPPSSTEEPVASPSSAAPTETTVEMLPVEPAGEISSSRYRHNFLTFPHPYASHRDVFDLQVIGPGRCIEMKAEPHIKAEVLSCIALGDYVDPVTSVAIRGRDGLTWRWVEHYFQMGFVDDRFLLGRKTGEVIEPASGVYDLHFPETELLYEAGRQRFFGRYDKHIYELGRVYKSRGGGPVRETLLTLDDLMAAHPDAFEELAARASNSKDIGFLERRGFVASPDGSDVYATVCTSAYGERWPAYCSDLLGIFYSADKGITWRYLGSVDPAGPDKRWHVIGVLPVDGDDPQLVMDKGSDRDSAVVLFPSGETRSVTEFQGQSRSGGQSHLLHDGRVVWEMTYMEGCCQWVAEDGEELGLGELPDEPLLHAVPEVEIPSSLYRHYLPGDLPPVGSDPLPDPEACRFDAGDCIYPYYLEYFIALSPTDGNVVIGGG